METSEHPLSWKAIGRIILTGLVIFLLWKAMSAVIDIIIALVLATSLHPLVYGLHVKTKLSMLVSTSIVFVLLLVPFIILGFTILPNLDTQLPQLLANIDSTTAHLATLAHISGNFSIIHYIQSHSSDILASSANIIMAIFSTVATLILTFYFVYDHKRLLKLFLSIFPYKEKTELRGLLEEVGKVTGKYIRGNLIISCITFIVILAGLLILRIPFALPLAIFAGVIDLLPLVGSTLGAIPALAVAFSISPVKGFLVLILHLIYQQAENAIISPAIYNKTLNLYPALGFLVVLVGASLFGILGAFLSLPIAASIPAIVEYTENYKQRNPNSGL